MVPPIKLNQNSTILIDTNWPQRFRLTKIDDNNTDYEYGGVATSVDFFKFVENVNYTLTRQQNVLNIKYLSGKDDHFSPIWSVALFLIGLQMLYSGLNFGVEYYLKKKSASVENPNYEETPKKDEPKNRVRLQSLDTFRGICITIMIFVNYGGQESRQPSDQGS